MSTPRLLFSQHPSPHQTLVSITICIPFSFLGIAGALPSSTDLAQSIHDIPVELQREGIHTPPWSDPFGLCLRPLHAPRYPHHYHPPSEDTVERNAPEIWREKIKSERKEGHSWLTQWRTVQEQPTPSEKQSPFTANQVRTPKDELQSSCWLRKLKLPSEDLDECCTKHF